MPRAPLNAVVVLATGVASIASAFAQVPQPGSIVVTDRVIGRTPTSVAVGMEDVNHEVYGGIYSQMVFGEAFAEAQVETGVSGQWRSTAPGAAYSITTQAPFKGAQSQKMERATSGDWAGIENRGLNRQGMSVTSGRTYEGVVVLRAPAPIVVRVSLQSADGRRLLAARNLVVTNADWSRLPFNLRAGASDGHARLALEIRSVGGVDVGYVMLQPGMWGRYKGLPVRSDVAHLLERQGVQALRFGGCANSGCGDVSEYRWKAMVGDPVLRPVTKGFWYPYESNGFGIFEFMQLGEALGVEAVPSLNIDEKPEDVRDLMDYLYGPATTTWGSRRHADGHALPYRQKRLQLGNENAVDDAYYRKFKALAEIVWSYDPGIRLVVGDFSYADVIRNPYDFEGGGKVRSLAAHGKILELASRYGAEVDFDIHLWTERTKGIAKQIRALDSYAAALKRLAPPGSRHRIVVFELNADKHDAGRALGNAYAITALQKRPYVDVISSANALQVDGQNDNGWDQGLVFMNQLNAWTQPPWHVHRMIASSLRSDAVEAEVRGGDEDWVQAAAFRDAKGASLNVTNASDAAVSYRIDFGAKAAFSRLRIETLHLGRERAVNTSENPDNVAPVGSRLRLDARGQAILQVPASSFITIQTEAPAGGATDQGGRR
ncbi:alpha-L-arabinofuranosidase C-terminal domain-containing protein [Sphingomonas sp. BK580]|uniref:alpha-L-arabinofuranosidase C-terminal domain-containing protein n=1 Tax=Sphingomonas sp. BK580 TaxID=2586972 RepID=UPI00160CB412|nr:alpha-L-arabinofuranosidase C-terminal domain-containing protein [Sphingomonas sp. BK580]MBB3695242.1 alpha-L-arabinofuranosidase [Sphingomonas sp. BK580]